LKVLILPSSGAGWEDKTLPFGAPCLAGLNLGSTLFYSQTLLSAKLKIFMNICIKLNDLFVDQYNSTLKSGVKNISSLFIWKW
jgi:hypothetical protein